MDFTKFFTTCKDEKMKFIENLEKQKEYIDSNEIKTSHYFRIGTWSNDYGPPLFKTPYIEATPELINDFQKVNNKCCDISKKLFGTCDPNEPIFLEGNGWGCPLVYLIL